MDICPGIAFGFPAFDVWLENPFGERYDSKAELTEDFTINFLTDVIICAMARWLLDKDCITPAQFVSKLKEIIQGGAVAIYQEMNPT